jgi:DNA-binding transcriptional ArsR family regulator
MVRKKIVYAEKEGQFRRYYTKPLDDEDKKVLSALRQKKIREVVLFIIVNEKAKYQSLSDNLKLTYSTLSFYLKYLVDREILVREKVGYETIYTVRDPDRVAKVLIAYKSGFLDKMVDKALNVWLESYSSKDAL